MAIALVMWLGKGGPCGWASVAILCYLSCGYLCYKARQLPRPQQDWAWTTGHWAILSTWWGLGTLWTERAELRPYSHEELHAFSLSLCPRQNEGLWVHQLHCFQEHKQTPRDQTGSRLSKERTRGNTKEPCQSENSYLISKGSRTPKLNPLSSHTECHFRGRSREKGKYIRNWSFYPNGRMNTNWERWLKLSGLTASNLIGHLINFFPLPSLTADWGIRKKPRWAASKMKKVNYILVLYTILTSIVSEILQPATLERC